MHLHNASSPENGNKIMKENCQGRGIRVKLAIQKAIQNLHQSILFRLD